jgi:hypothetical protein
MSYQAVGIRPFAHNAKKRAGTAIGAKCLSGSVHLSRDPTKQLNAEHGAVKSNVPQTKDTSSPKHHLQDQAVAALFHSFAANISPWYDLGDTACTFGRLVPQVALREPLMLHAIVALSGMHAAKTSSKASTSLAERHHEQCVKLLISLGEDDGLVRTGVALAATCLLRSYEILSGEFSLQEAYQGQN